MGCASSSGGPVVSGQQPSIQPATDLDGADPTLTGQQQGQDEDAFVTSDEATDYVMQELGISRDRALQMALTVGGEHDGKVPCIELVLLNERIKEIKEHLAPKFEAHDPDATGFVSPEVAARIILEEFSGLPVESVASMVKRFDSDGNNEVDFSEFIEFYAFIKAKKTDVEQRFDALDKDKSGDLDAEELIQMLVQECSLEEIQARILVEDFDLDKDGTIDKDEFMTMWLRLFG